MQDFGNPPVFPAQEEVEVVEEKSEVESQILICHDFTFFLNQDVSGDNQGQVEGKEEQSCGEGRAWEVPVADHAVSGDGGQGNCQVLTFEKSSTSSDFRRF